MPQGGRTILSAACARSDWNGVDRDCQWFVKMATRLGHDVWIGDAAKIRAAEVRQQEHDRRDAALILKLLVDLW
jgi:hypothetical protein